MAKSLDLGDAGENLIREFVDSTFTKYFNFRMAKNELADVIIWWSYVLFLIEVRTKTTSKQSPNEWAKDVIHSKVDQLERQYDRILAKEKIHLVNEWYNVELNYDGLHTVGIIILVTDDDLSVIPQDIDERIFHKKLPIHVFSFRDFLRLRDEVDTVHDLALYLSDRYRYLKRGATVPLDREMELVGLYKKRNPPNTFPKAPINFAKRSFWNEYQKSHSSRIIARNKENLHSERFDELVDLLPNIKTHLEEKIPRGLVFAWQLGGLLRRWRAYCGEYLLKVDDAFTSGKRNRKYALWNQGTEQWIVFLYSEDEPREIRAYLQDLVRTKWLKEKLEKNSDQRVLGLAFKRTNQSIPCEWECIDQRIFPVNNKKDNQITQSFTQDDLDRANRYWASRDKQKQFRVLEWPED